MEDYSALIRRVAQAVEETAAARFARPSATYRLQFAPETMTFGRRRGAGSVSGLAGRQPPLRLAVPQVAGKAAADTPSSITASFIRPWADRRNIARWWRNYIATAWGKSWTSWPNHMSADAGENRWWRDVLGKRSQFALRPVFRHRLVAGEREPSR